MEEKTENFDQGQQIAESKQKDKRVRVTPSIRVGHVQKKNTRAKYSDVCRA